MGITLGASKMYLFAGAHCTGSRSFSMSDFFSDFLHDVIDIDVRYIIFCH